MRGIFFSKKRRQNIKLENVNTKLNDFVRIFNKLI